jgi:hypothetical protein
MLPHTDVKWRREGIQSLTVSGYSFFREIQKASIDMF